MPNNLEMAEALKSYPTNEDAQYAKDQDWSYGQPFDPYFKGKQLNLLMGDPNARPLQMNNLKLDRFARGSSQNIDNYYAKAALAANRSPLAALGFDPTKAAVDFGIDPEKATNLGSYTPKYDQMYVNGQTPVADTLVHESMHRGIEKLKASDLWNNKWPSYDFPTKDFPSLTGLKMHENTVRKLMHDKAGDPEGKVGAEGNEDKAQRANALKYFDDVNFPGRGAHIKQMEAAAALLYARNRPVRADHPWVKATTESVRGPR